MVKMVRQLLSNQKKAQPQSQSVMVVKRLTVLPILIKIKMAMTSNVKSQHLMMA